MQKGFVTLSLSARNMIYQACGLGGYSGTKDRGGTFFWVI